MISKVQHTFENYLQQTSEIFNKLSRSVAVDSKVKHTTEKFHILPKAPANFQQLQLTSYGFGQTSCKVIKFSRTAVNFTKKIRELVGSKSFSEFQSTFLNLSQLWKFSASLQETHQISYKFRELPTNSVNKTFRINSAKFLQVQLSSLNFQDI